MAVLHRDGFDTYAADADMAKNWNFTTPWAFNATGGRNGGGCAQAVNTAGGVLRSRSVLAGVAGTSIRGFKFWLKLSAAPAANQNIVMIRDGGGGVAYGLRITTGGLLAFTNNGTSEQLTGNVNVADNAWHWVEWYTRSANGGLQKAWVDTLAQWNTNPAGSAPVFDTYEFISVTNRTITIDDDIAIDENGTGLIVSGMPYGPRQISTFRPNADGDSKQYVPSTGVDNYAMVDDTVADGDATYVESAVLNDLDLYAYENMSFSPSQINTVVAVAVLENPNPGVVNFRQVAKNVATINNGSSIQVPSNYQAKLAEYSVDPNTSAAWTQGGFNTAQFGHQNLGG